MTFAKSVFAIAALLGVMGLAPMYLAAGPPLYHSALAGLLAWQAAFVLIASDPGRYRPMMIPSVIEKFLWVGTFVVLYARGVATAAEVVFWVPISALLGMLFVIAFLRTVPARDGGAAIRPQSRVTT